MWLLIIKISCVISLDVLSGSGLGLSSIKRVRKKMRTFTTSTDVVHVGL